VAVGRGDGAAMQTGTGGGRRSEGGGKSELQQEEPIVRLLSPSVRVRRCLHQQAHTNDGCVSNAHASPANEGPRAGNSSAPRRECTVLAHTTHAWPRTRPPLFPPLCACVCPLCVVARRSFLCAGRPSKRQRRRMTGARCRPREPSPAQGNTPRGREGETDTHSSGEQ
jgi:hypothetical protein